MPSRARVVLGVDVGISTGVAVLNLYGEIICTKTVEHTPEENEPSLSQLLMDLHEEYDVVLTAIENPVEVPGEFGRTLRSIADTVLRAVTSRVLFVQPGTWKTSFARNAYPDYKFGTTHESDAASIAFYALVRTGAANGN